MKSVDFVDFVDFDEEDDELTEDELTGEDGNDANDPDDPDDPLATSGAIVPVKFLTGQAGTGKTWTVRERIAADPDFGVLCSTTGISAINLGEGVTTINSLLAYFDTESMRDRYKQGKLAYRLNHRVVKDGYRNIVVDEVSMMPKEQLQILYNAIAEVNASAEMARRNRKLGLILTGDFAQLAPVPEKDSDGKSEETPWAFKGDCWEEFDARTHKLTSVKRQADAGFLAAINAARRGDGGESVERLVELGVEMGDETTDDFDGTTILATNEAVDRYNEIRAMDLAGQLTRPPIVRWGMQKAEWRRGLPNTPPGRDDEQRFKIGAYVMILANGYSAPGVLEYANGDCGWIESCVYANDRATGEKRPVFVVRLKRGPVVEVPALTRLNTQKEKPGETVCAGNPAWAKGGVHVKPFREDGRWVIGGVTYFPLRYAFASTVYKTQGLTLDACQIDLRPHFLGKPNQLYVAMSRCRTAAGLRLVGGKDLFVRRCNVDPEVRRWL